MMAYANNSGYKNQWLSITLTKTKPSKLILQSKDGQFIQPRVLDPDHQDGQLIQQIFYIEI